MEKRFNGYTPFQLEQSIRYREDSGLAFPDDKEFNEAWQLYQKELQATIEEPNLEAQTEEPGSVSAPNIKGQLSGDFYRNLYDSRRENQTGREEI